MSSASSIVILLLEDEEDDYILTQEAIDYDSELTPIYRVKDGLEGLAYLEKGEGMADAPDGRRIPFKDCPVPDLIICDLIMPKMDGREFIARLKLDKHWRRIPVVVLTNSRDERDVLESYDTGAAAYIVKPINVFEMEAVVRQIRDFYLTIARLPRRGD